MLSFIKIFRRTPSNTTQAKGSLPMGRMERTICDFLQTRVNRMNSVWVFSCCGVFLLVVFIISLSAIWNAFDTTPVHLPEHIIKIPKHIGHTDGSAKSASDRKAIDSTVQSYSLYLDSIRKNNYWAYDSIQMIRPGLIDSLHFLQTIIK